MSERRLKGKGKGLFISFEGIDGSGKSTHIRLLSERLEAEGYPFILPREPGGTEVGEGIRHLLLNKKNLAIGAETELLLFLASRAQLCQEVIGPALERGTLVLCDRFMDSSVAYQGYGRSLGPQRVEAMNRFAVKDLVPDLTILLEARSQVTDHRLHRRGEALNRLDLESAEFMERIRLGYQEMAQREPDRFVRVDSGGEISEVASQIWHVVRRALDEINLRNRE